MGMHEETADAERGVGALSRRGLFVSGGLLTAASARSAPQGIATASAAATTTKIAVVTHGDTARSGRSSRPASIRPRRI